MASAAPPCVVLSGDLVRDHHLYAEEDARIGAVPPVTVAHTELGGVALLHRLVGAVCEGAAAVHLGIDTSAPVSEAHAVWAPAPPAPGGGPPVWRVRQVLGFGAPIVHPPPPAAAIPAPDVLVLDDGGRGFRHGTHRALWHLPDDGAARTPRWILLKHSGPVAQDDLWHDLAARFADRLVVLVAADELRREAVALPRALSWEAGVGGVYAALRAHPRLNRLTRCRHVVVSFMADGALWLDSTDRASPRATLCYDAGGAEGEWAARHAGGGFGFQSALAAALTQHLVAHAAGPADAPLELAPALQVGLRAKRDLLANGHGPAHPSAPPAGYPVARLAGVLREGAGGFAQTELPWDDTLTDPHWSILESAQRPPGPDPHPAPLLGLAMEVVRQGTVALERLPHARFGALVAADRGEIETLRHLRGLMRRYAAEPRPKHPLSIGVFGPPGAGKSFGVKELAREIFGVEGWLEFNLSQFQRPEDLHGAFHRVRDLVLAGRTPVAFWDEFDSQDLRWLQYLLAPMQDGAFQAGQLVHAVGKCVYVFAGGTMPSLRRFAEREAEPAFKAAKGPDFVSRLDAHFDVLGPNQHRTDDDRPDPADLGVPLRRALLLRGQLRFGRRERLAVDDGLLRALLGVPHYLHGSRSMEKLVLALRDGAAAALVRSALPSAGQLAMHVPAEPFLELLEPRAMSLEDLASSEAVETVAAAIHETWRALSREQDWAMQPHLDRPYGELDEGGREDNRAAARRMPAILALAGLAMTRGEGLPEATVRAQIERNLDRLAEAEHDGWMAHRALNGWRWAEQRDDAKRLHPAMRPYAELPEAEKRKDRNSVRHYPAFVTRAGFAIGFLA